MQGCSACQIVFESGSQLSCPDNPKCPNREKNRCTSNDVRPASELFCCMSKVSFLRNCGTVSVGKLNTKIWVRFPPLRCNEAGPLSVSSCSERMEKGQLSASLYLYGGNVMERTRTSAKCPKMKNARAKRAKLLFFNVKYVNL